MFNSESRRFKRIYRKTPMIEGAAIASALALALHIGLYRWRGVLWLPVKYALGVAAILAGLWHACAERDDMNAAWDATLIAVASGVVVTGAHVIRKLQFERNANGAVRREHAHTTP